MANLRQIKKQINYSVNEVIYDCYLAMYFHNDKKGEIINIMKDAADLRNNLIEMVNHPAEKNNKSLVKKHYSFVRTEATDRIEGLFEKLCKTINS